MSRLQEIFIACLNVPASQREGLLDVLCAQDQELRSKVQRLLEADQKNIGSGFLEPKQTLASNWGGRSIGSCIGIYQITHLVGVGGFGTVYRTQRSATTHQFPSHLHPPLTPASHPESACFAVKVLHPWLVNTSAFERFRREERALRLVDHPHVARFIDSGIETDGTPYIVTEFVEGVSLEQRVCNAQGHTVVTAVPLSTRVGWIVDICHGLQAAHEHLMLHRDLKPSNILISHDQRAIVTDFGIAKHLTDNGGTFTTGHGLLGSVHFMAPEQVHHQGELGLTADVYGIGGLIYFLLTGKPPHAVPLHCVGGEKPQINSPQRPRQFDPKIPKDLETICLKCLHQEPERRYASANIVAEELTRFLRSQPIMSRPVGTLEATGYWMRRNRLQARLIAVSLLGGLIAIGSIIYLWQQATQQYRRAEQNLHTAVSSYQALRDVISRLLDALKVAEQNPATTRLQLELLISINQAFEEISRTSEPDRELQRSHAICLFKLGRLQLQFEQMDAYVESIEKAELLFLTLAEAEPENPQHWFDVFHCRNALYRNEDALEAIESVCLLDGGETLAYLDCLAHSKIRLAESLMFHSASLPQAIELSDQASTIAARNLDSDPTDWHHWKKMGEAHSLQAKIAIASSDFATALIKIEQGIEAYQQALIHLPNDREIVRLMMMNVDLKLTLETDRQDWDAATQTAIWMLDLARSYQVVDSRIVNHYRLVASAIKANLFVAWMDQRHDAAIALGYQWRDAVENWVAAFPNNYAGKLEQAICDTVLHRLYPETFSADRFEGISRDLQNRMAETNLIGLSHLENILALYLLGQQEASRRLAEEVFELDSVIADQWLDVDSPWRRLFAQLSIPNYEQRFNLLSKSQIPGKVRPQPLFWRYTFFRKLLE